MIFESEWYKYAPKKDRDGPSFQLRVSAREQHPGHVVVQARVADKLVTFAVPAAVARAFVTDLVSACSYAERAGAGRASPPPAEAKGEDDTDRD